MIKLKVCMLGAFAAGKTSLVRRYVHSIFSDKYHTTVGVKIDKKNVTAKNREVDLILWDLHGEDEFQNVRMSYLRGSSGCIYVVDGTRHATLDAVFNLKSTVESSIGKLPFVLAFNKWDLSQEWEIDEATLDDFRGDGTVFFKTSAKTGLSVEELFRSLTAMILER